MNLQTIEKQHLDPNGFLEVHHTFLTIQGEGPYVGYPAVFIRLAGCNLQCPWCDTEYTSIRKNYSPEQIVDLVAFEVRDTQANLVVFTGGEPMRQNITPAIHKLIEYGYEVQIETNGTLWVPGLPVHDENFCIVCSPKSGSLNNELVPHVKAFKYVLDADNVDPYDGLPTRALDHPAHPRVARPPVEMSVQIYVQPMDEKEILENERNLQATIKSCMNFGYTLCLQTQKIIDLE